MVEQRGVVALSDEGDLVFEIGEPVVDWRGGEHQYAGLHALLDDAPHEAVVAGLLVFSRAIFVSEVVRLVDDDEVVVAPVDVGEFDVAGLAAVAGEVGVIQDIVVESVRGEDVAAVVGLVERPVVAEALWHEHEDAVVAQLVVFDDGERLEGFSETHAVGDNAAAEAFQFVDGSDHAVALELEELFPNVGFSDASGGFDDLVLVEFVPAIFEEVVDCEEVNQRRLALGGEFIELSKQGGFPVGGSRQVIPHLREPSGEKMGFLRRLRRLHEAELIGWRKAEPVGGERAIAADDFGRRAVRIFSHQSRLRERSRRGFHFNGFAQPFGEVTSKLVSGKLIARATVGIGAEKQLSVRLRGRNNQA